MAIRMVTILMVMLTTTTTTTTTMITTMGTRIRRRNLTIKSIRIIKSSAWRLRSC